MCWDVVLIIMYEAIGRTAYDVVYRYAAVLRVCMFICMYVAMYVRWYVCV